MIGKFQQCRKPEKTVNQRAEKQDHGTRTKDRTWCRYYIMWGETARSLLPTVDQSLEQKETLQVYLMYERSPSLVQHMPTPDDLLSSVFLLCFWHPGFQTSTPLEFF